MFHLAHYIYSCRKMVFVNACSIEYLSDVFLVDATTCQELDRRQGIFFQFLFQLGKQADTIYCLRLLTRSQDSVASQRNNIFKGFHGICSTVESTVEGY